MDTIHAERFNSARTSWTAIRRDILRIERQQFGDGAFDEEYLREVFEDPQTVAVLLLEGPSRHLVGFSCAIPEGMLDPERKAESHETAHVVDTAIETAHQGRGLVGLLMTVLERELRSVGYRYLEREAAVANGYAGKIARAYAGRIVEQCGPFESEWGRQVFFRIRL